VLGGRLGGSPRIGVVLGSGLGGFAATLADPVSVAYAEVPHMAPPSVAGHAGRFVLGSVEGVPVLCAAGRVHRYEGHPVAAVVAAVRLMARAGCSAVLLTNAAGGIAERLQPGSLMLLTDHLNLSGTNPLCGWPDPFIDMSAAYDPALRALGRQAAADAGVEVAEGVYAGVLGPSYETPAEIRMLAHLGADAVGMSTVLETIALRRESVSVGAVSCITNFAAGRSPTPLGHEEVQEVARRLDAPLNRLLARWVVLAASRTPGGDRS
jgi:purine-nucleoside phosphorylase